MIPYEKYHTDTLIHLFTGFMNVALSTNDNNDEDILQNIALISVAYYKKTGLLILDKINPKQPPTHMSDAIEYYISNIYFNHV